MLMKESYYFSCCFDEYNTKLDFSATFYVDTSVYICINSNAMRVSYGNPKVRKQRLRTEL